MDESSRSFIVKREKSKKQGKGSQAFFSRNLNFFLRDNGRRQILSFGRSLSVGGFCGFWDFVGSKSQSETA